MKKIKIIKIDDEAINRNWLRKKNIEIDIRSLKKQEKRVYIKLHQTKRGSVKGHYRTIKINAKKPETTENIVKKISAYTKTGKVNLPGVSDADLKGILKGLDNTLGLYNTKVDEIKFGTAVPYAIGLYDTQWNTLEFTQDKFATVRSDIKKETENFRKYRNENIKEIKGQLERGIQNPILEQEQRKRLAAFEAMKRFNVMSDVPENEIVSALTTHEAYHKIYWDNKLQYEWDRAISEMAAAADVPLHQLPQALSVSEYGATSPSELFAEVGAALVYNLPIDNELKKLFNKMLARIKK